MPHPSLASRSVLASQPTSSFQLLSTQAPMTDVYDCIVIGAGWSGVVAARSLARAGNKVVILEARDRVGGRARTYTDAGMHAPIDLGCSWIHGYKEGNPARDIAEQLNIATHVLAATESMILGDAGPLPSDRTAVLQQSLQKELASASLSAQDILSDETDRPLHDVLLAKSLFSGGDGESVLTLARSLEVPYGVELERVSSRWQGWANPFAGSDAGPEGGFQSLVQRVLDDAKQHGAEVRLSAMVDHVRQVEDKVSISIGGDTILAWTAITTIPLGVLKLSASSLFDPPLPKRQLAAIERTHVGVLEKLALAYPSAWWPSAESCGSYTFLPRKHGKSSANSDEGAVHAALDRCTVVVASFAAPTLPHTHPTLLFYLSPTPATALAEYSDAAVAAGAHAFLRERLQVASDAAPAPQASVRTAWAQDPLSRGATTTPPVLGSGGPFDFAELARPAWSGKLGFAGEHTDMDNRGSVAGAVISGQREADRVGRLLRCMKRDT